MDAEVRKPTAKPTAMVTAMPSPARLVSASTRPATIPRRDTGSERRRSNRPAPTSSATAVEEDMPEKSTPTATKPGTRKST